MKKTIAVTTLALASIGMSSSANAQDISFYTGVGLGTINTEHKAAGVDQTATTFGGFVKLGADFNDYFAAEMRVGMSGKNKKTYAANTFTYSSPIFVSYLAKVKYPVLSNVDLYMLAGATTARIKGTSDTATQSKSKTGLSIGVGFDYKLNNNVSLGADWMQYMFPVKMTAGSVFTNDSKARMWGLTSNATYHF
ncbi:porin family protein [Mariprofundus ferrooxydans]|nr:porin family protein [Mariprofundus ferrooxydans]